MKKRILEKADQVSLKICDKVNHAAIFLLSWWFTIIGLMVCRPFYVQTPCGWILSGVHTLMLRIGCPITVAIIVIFGLAGVYVTSREPDIYERSKNSTTI